MGISSHGHYANLTIRNNVIERNGRNTQLDHGIYLGNGSGYRVLNNVIRNNAAYGVQIWPNANDVLIQGNAISGQVHKGGIVAKGTNIRIGANPFRNNALSVKRY